MKTLEIKPLKDRRLAVLIVEKEYNEPFGIPEAPADSNSQKISLYTSLP